MASFLAAETRAECVSVRSFQDLYGDDHGANKHPSLALWDCFGKDAKGCLSELDFDGRKVLAQDYLALFNIGPWLGIEEEAVERGARGFFYLEEQLEQFTKGVVAIFNGELWASRKLMSEFIMKNRKRNRLPTDVQAPLTPRETEILQMLAGGYSNARIADELFISTHTVKTHLYNIYKKIEVPSRFQAALWAVKNL